MAGKRILVVGAGFGGLYAAMGLRRAVELGHRVTVVNPENFMQYQPFLPEVASGTIDPRAVVVPLRRVLRHCEVVIGEVERVDHDERTARVRLADGRRVATRYDVVVLAPGSWARVLPIPGLAEHGVGFKTVQEAIWLRNQVLSRLDVAAETDDPERRRAAMTFVFVGGGYAGVEALGELEDLARDALESYPGLRPDQMRWTLVEAAGSILPEIGCRPRPLRARAPAGARDRGPAGDAARLGGGRHAPPVRRAGVPLGHARVDRGGQAVAPRVRVRVPRRRLGQGADRRVPPRRRRRGRVGVRRRGGGAGPARRAASMPPTAQHGMRQGKRLASNLVAVLEGRTPEPFDYRGIGAVVSLGRYKGVAVIRGVRLRGFPAWFAHRSYHLYAMPTLTRKVKIAADWTVALLFPRDLAQLGSLEHPREPFERAAGAPPTDRGD